MPFALLIIGLIFIVTGVKGTTGAMSRQLAKDFTGSGNFLYWFAAIGSVGALGAIPSFKNFSRVFMTLILVAMVIRNGGVFDNIIRTIKTGPISPERDGQTGQQSESTLAKVAKGPLADPSSIGGQAVSYTQAMARKSIDASVQQTSDPARNFGAVAKVAGKIFGF